MSHQRKNSIKSNYHQILFLPLITTIQPKKTKPEEQPEENAVLFHLQIIKKIDSLLQQHNRDHAPLDAQSTAQDNSFLPPSIEPRPSLSKTLAHHELTWRPSAQMLQRQSQTMPEEFKTELNRDPPFKFITGQEFTNDFITIQTKPQERIEIIDLALFSQSPLPQTMHDLRVEEQPVNHIPPTPRKNPWIHRDSPPQKLQVIDTETLKQEQYQKIFNAAQKQSQDIEQKSKIYYLRNKANKEQKQSKGGNGQSYIPIDFEQRMKIIREQQQEKERQQREERERLQKQQQEEEERLRKQQQEEEERLQKKQKEEEEKLQKKLQKEQEKLQKIQQEKERQQREEEERLQKKFQREQEKLQMLQEEKERQQAAEEERLQKLQSVEEESLQKEFQKEQERLEKLQQIKEKLEEKKQGTHYQDTSSLLKKIQLDGKKQIQERERQRRIEEKKKKIQERQRIKQEIKALKEKQKQQRLKQKLKQKQQITKEKPSLFTGLKKETRQPSEQLDDEIIQILRMTDTLLAALSDDVINRFAKSKDFELYEKVMNKYKIK